MPRVGDLKKADVDFRVVTAAVTEKRWRLLRLSWRSTRSAAPRRLRPPMRDRWTCGPLLTVLLIEPLALADVSSANAQTIIGPGTITTTQTVTSANSPATVVGNTTINVPSGDGIDAPPNAAPGGTLIINTEAGPSAGPISITSGGTGVVMSFPASPATVSINSGPS